MSDQFVGEVRIVGFNFPPRGWATCDGQLLPISQNTALFSLLGTNFGGDGKANFGLPNLLGSAVVGAGNGPGLTPRSVGESGGSQAITLLQTEMPSHNHTLEGLAGPATTQAPSNLDANSSVGAAVGVYSPGPTTNVQMSPSMVGTFGGSQPHNNMQAYQVVLYCIALQGIFPPRG